MGINRRCYFFHLDKYSLTFNDLKYRSTSLFSCERNKRTLELGDKNKTLYCIRLFDSRRAIYHPPWRSATSRLHPKYVCCSISFLTVIYVYQRPHYCGISAHALNQSPLLFFLACTAGDFSRYFLAVFSRTRHLGREENTDYLTQRAGALKLN
jgi:hypothetical protein